MVAEGKVLTVLGTLNADGFVYGEVVGENVSYNYNGVSYIDVNGELKTQDGVIIISTDNPLTAWGNSSGDAVWYLIRGELTFADRVTVTGNVHLILADGAKLTAERGIAVTEGNSLTVYAQIDGTGILEAKGEFNAAGIGGNDAASGELRNSGTVVINGGTVMAQGGGNAAGIGGASQGAGGTVTVNGGTVTATGGTDGAGIGGGSYGAGGTVTVNGGTVTATGTAGGAGIGSGQGATGADVTVTGGTVSAIGGSDRTQGIGAGEGSSAHGSFLTGADGNAIIKASSIGDRSATENWNGIISTDGGVNYTVYGKQTVIKNLTLGGGLTVPSGAVLKINKHVTLSATGITVEDGGVLLYYGGTNLQLTDSISGFSVVASESAAERKTYYQVCYNREILPGARASAFNAQTLYTGLDLRNVTEATLFAMKGGGYAIYDPTAKKLYLYGAKMNEGVVIDGKAYGIYSDTDLEVVLVGFAYSNWLDQISSITLCDEDFIILENSVGIYADGTLCLSSVRYGELAEGIDPAVAILIEAETGLAANGNVTVSGAAEAPVSLEVSLSDTPLSLADGCYAKLAQYANFYVFEGTYVGDLRLGKTDDGVCFVVGNGSGIVINGTAYRFIDGYIVDGILDVSGWMEGIYAFVYEGDGGEHGNVFDRYAIYDADQSVLTLYGLDGVTLRYDRAITVRLANDCGIYLDGDTVAYAIVLGSVDSVDNTSFKLTLLNDKLRLNANLECRDAELVLSTFDITVGADAGGNGYRVVHNSNPPTVTVDGVSYEWDGSVLTGAIDLSAVTKNTYYKANEGYMLYLPEQNKLCMVNATFACALEAGDMAAISHGGNLTLILQGDNKIVVSGGASATAYGLQAAQKLTVTAAEAGGGTLTVKADTLKAVLNVGSLENGAANSLLRIVKGEFDYVIGGVTYQNGGDVEYQNMDLTIVSLPTFYYTENSGGYALFTPAVDNSNAKLELHGVLIMRGSISAADGLEIVLYGDNMIVGDVPLINVSGTLTVSAGDGTGVLRLSAGEGTSAIIDGNLAATDCVLISFGGMLYEWGGEVSGNLNLEGLTQLTFYQDTNGNRIFLNPDADSAVLLLYGVAIGDITYGGDLTLSVYGTVTVESVVTDGILNVRSGDTDEVARLTLNGNLTAKYFSNDITIYIYGAVTTATGETNVNDGNLTVQAGSKIDNLLMSETAEVYVFLNDTAFGQGIYHNGTVYLLSIPLRINVDLYHLLTYFDFGEGSGYAIYDPSQKTLALHGVKLFLNEANAIVASGDLTVMLYGENEVNTSRSDSGNAVAILVDGNLTVEGSGKLTVTAGMAAESRASSIAIGVGGNLTVGTNATVVANAGMAQYSIAVQAVGSVSVYGNLTANGGDATLDLIETVEAEILSAQSAVSVAIYAKSVQMQSSGRLTVSCENGDYIYFFLTDDENLTPANEKITVLWNEKAYAWGGDVSQTGILLTDVSLPTYYIADAKKSGRGYAIFTPATETAVAKLELFDATVQGEIGIEFIFALDLVLSGKSIVVKTEERAGGGALRTVGDLTVSGNGSLTAKTIAGNNVTGICVIEGDLTVKNGVTLSGIAQNGTEGNIGVEVDGDLTVEAGAFLNGEGDCEILVKGTVSNEGTLSDAEAPEADVTVGESEVFFTNASDSHIDYFFKNSVKFNITAEDAESTVRSVFYYIGDSELNPFEITQWQNITDLMRVDFAPETVGMYRIYLRLLDTAGNESIVFSPILVWYMDAVPVVAPDTYYMHSLKALIAQISQNGNLLISGADGVSVDGGNVTFDGEMLEALGAGKHEFTLTVKPLGLDYVDGAINHAPASVVLTVHAEYFVPALGAQYTLTELNADGWTNGNFTVTAKEGYLLSTDKTDWNAALTVTEETANGILKFFVKRVSDGAISKPLETAYKIDKTAPVFTGVTNGAVCYTTQIYTVTDANMETLTVSVAGNRAERYTATYTDPAGNSVTVAFAVRPIADLSVPIDALNESNVKSTDVEAVKAVKSAVLAANTAHATDAELAALAAITEKCDALLLAVEAAKAEGERITEHIETFVPESVKSDDTEELEALLTDMESLLAGGNLTDDEAKKLTETKAEIEELLKTIEETAQRIDSVMGTVENTDPDTVKPSESKKLDEAIKEIDDLLATDHLTDAEKKSLKATKADAEVMRATIWEVLDKVDSCADEVGAVDTDSLKSSDVKTLEGLSDEIKAFLRSPHLEDAQKAKLNEQLDAIGGYLDIIEKIEERVDLVINVIEFTDPDTVKPSESKKLDEAIKEIDDLLATDHLTDAEKESLKATKADAEALKTTVKETLERVADLTHRVDVYTPTSVTSDDLAPLQTLNREMYEFIDSPHLDAEHKQTLGEKKDAVLEMIAVLAELEKDLSDATAALSSVSESNVKSFHKDALTKAIADANALIGGGHLTDSEKTALRSAIEKANALIKQAEANIAEIERIRAEGATIDPDKVKTDDKTALEALAGAIDTLFATDHLTDAERNALDDIVELLECGLYMIEQAQTMADAEVFEAVADVTSETLSLEHTEALSKAIAAMNLALNENGAVYTDAEKEEMEKHRDEWLGYLQVIDRVKLLIEMLDTLPNADGLQADDGQAVTAIEAVKSYYDTMSDSLRAMIGDDRIEKMDALLKKCATYESLHEEVPTWKSGSGNALMIKTNGYRGKLMGILIGGEDVDPSRYTVREGSTVIVLSADLLDTLAIGEHTVTVLYPDGKVEIQIEIARDLSWIPVTVVTVVLLALAAVNAVLFIGYRKKKRVPDPSICENVGSDSGDGSAES